MWAIITEETIDNSNISRYKSFVLSKGMVDISYRVLIAVQCQSRPKVQHDQFMREQKPKLNKNTNNKYL